MVNFYVDRLERLATPEERSAYLNNTVVASLREQVKLAYNSKNPQSKIDA